MIASHRSPSFLVPVLLLALSALPIPALAQARSSPEDSSFLAAGQEVFGELHRRSDDLGRVLPELPQIDDIDRLYEIYEVEIRFQDDAVLLASRFDARAVELQDKQRALQHRLKELGALRLRERAAIELELERIRHELQFLHEIREALQSEIEASHERAGAILNRLDQLAPPMEMPVMEEVTMPDNFVTVPEAILAPPPEAGSAPSPAPYPSPGGGWTSIGTPNTGTVPPTISLPLILSMRDRPIRPSRQSQLASVDVERDQSIRYLEEPFVTTFDKPLAAMPIESEGASYAMCRSALRHGRLPDSQSVRIEELLNYFPCALRGLPEGESVAAQLELSSCPWNPEHELLMVSLYSAPVRPQWRPKNHFVFVVDISESMSFPEKSPLLQQSMKALVRDLNWQDRVTIVGFDEQARAGLILGTTILLRTDQVDRSIERMELGKLRIESDLHQLAQRYLEPDRSDDTDTMIRAILASDGDFGSREEAVFSHLRSLFQFPSEDEKEHRIASISDFHPFHLNVIGLGQGNYGDERLRDLAALNHGTYAYVDSVDEARRVLLENADTYLRTTVSDLSFQIEFNPDQVDAYRLIGYDVQASPSQAGPGPEKTYEMGPGQGVTAFFELVPANPGAPGPMLTVYLDYEVTGTDLKQNFVENFDRSQLFYRSPSQEFQLASAVAEFGLLLRESDYQGDASYERVVARIEEAIGDREEGLWAEFMQLARTARDLSREPNQPASDRIIVDRASEVP